MNMQTTIAAIATPIGKGGIGIIRMSGTDALCISLKLFSLPSLKIPQVIESHRIYYGHIRDKGNHVVDEVLYVYMKGPRSYTAEDVVEIQSHSSPVVLRKILDLLLNSGAVLAEPGEFTRRAFLNGRIDLTQAEAVIDIINARTGTSLNMAISQVRGHLKHEIHTIRHHMIELYSRIEAMIDFPDDVGDVFDLEEFLGILDHEVLSHLYRLKQDFDDFNMFRDGIRIIIVGPPNSGKSSLLNALLNKEKSIVTPIPGTTRDLIDDIINIDGIPFEITDTAGIQETGDQVEQMGIERTFDKLKESDLIILMLDASTQLSENETQKILSVYNDNKDTKKIIVVENKIDLIGDEHSKQTVLTPDIRISVSNRIGLDVLKQRIADVMIADLPENRSSIVPNVRHSMLIDQCIESVVSVVHGLKNDTTFDLIAVDVKSALSYLDEILGLDAGAEVLDRIFDMFCIGK